MAETSCLNWNGATSTSRRGLRYGFTRAGSILGSALCVARDARASGDLLCAVLFVGRDVVTVPAIDDIHA